MGARGLPQPAAYAVPALEKGLDVLEALAAGEGAPTLAELARALGRSPGELFRTLVCLERRGYVAREASSGRYRLTLKLFELSRSHSPVEDLLRAADRPMRELARRVRESCHLSVLSEGGLLVLAQAESPSRVRLSVEVGARYPVVHTASGRLLLAHLDPDARDEILSKDPDFLKLGAARRRAFLSELLKIRRIGASIAVSETTMGVRDVAVLVGNPRVGVLAALCVPALTGMRGRVVSIPRLREAVRRAADAITGALGLSRKKEGR
ncbi:MAG: IclR family transcriptional regulator [Planctomycetota bacterium]